MDYHDEEVREEELAVGSVKEASGEDANPGDRKKKPAVGARKRFFRIIANKYLLTILIFLVWILFFDSNNLISRFRVKTELRHLHRQKEYYIKEIDINSGIRDQLMHNPDEVETYGREKYLMKRDQEDLFLIIEEEEPAK